MENATRNITTEKELLVRLKKLMAEKSYRAIQRDHFPEISLPTLRRMGNGQFPKTKRIRDLLGLPLLVSVNACPNCGGKHPIRKCSIKKKKEHRVWACSKKELETIAAYMRFFRSRENESVIETP